MIKMILLIVNRLFQTSAQGEIIIDPGDHTLDHHSLDHQTFDDHTFDHTKFGDQDYLNDCKSPFSNVFSRGDHDPLWL